MIRQFVSFLFAAAMPAVALAADSPNGWSITVWPNAALLAEQRTRDGYIDLTQSISCVPGDKLVSWRTYSPAGEPRAPGARKGCDTQCRTEVVVTGADGRRPSGFTERRLPWSEARQGVGAEAPDAAAAFARKCRLATTSQATAPLQQDASSARSWGDPKLTWRLIRERTTRSSLPFDFVIPENAWDYGAVSSTFNTQAPAIVRLEAEGLKGRSGIALVQPDGSALTSGEHVIEAGRRATLYLRLKPAVPSAVLLRNYDAAGVAGSLRVLSVAVVAEDALTPEERAAVEASVR